MALLTWTADLSTGNKFIDADHHKLIEMVNALLDSIAQAHASDHLADVLQNLIVYTREHFDREEAEMRRIHYPAMGAHRAEHAQLLKQIIELKSTLNAREKVNSIGVHNFLSRWVRNHILDVDMKLAAALKDST